MLPIHAVNRLLGPGQPCLLIAEIGVNHNGDMTLAHRTIDAAVDAGADAVKFQNYRTEDFIGDRSLTYEYRSQGKMVVESQYDMFKRYELTPAALVELSRHCRERGVLFSSTPTGADGVENLVRAGVALLKNGSDCLGHLPLIRAMGASGVPTLISTGMATLADIDEAVRAFREAGGKDLILLACTSAYPTPPQDVRLRSIAMLSAAFDCPAGLSDHSEGTVAAIGAVALGACAIEKHFTLDRNLPGPDHWFSSDPAEFRELVAAVRSLEKSLQPCRIIPAPSELAARREYRLSCVAASELSAGHRLREPDIAFRRPGSGLPPPAVAWLVGRQLARNVTGGHVFQPEDFV